MPAIALIALGIAAPVICCAYQNEAYIIARAALSIVAPAMATPQTFIHEPAVAEPTANLPLGNLS